jgi:hypothetical protein
MPSPRNTQGRALEIGDQYTEYIRTMDDFSTAYCWIAFSFALQTFVFQRHSLRSPSEVLSYLPLAIQDVCPREKSRRSRIPEFFGSADTNTLFTV